MVAGRADTDTLESRFKSLLASQGIDVDFDINDDGLEDITRPGSEAEEDDVNGAKNGHAWSSRESRQQSRRASTSSIYEAGLWKTGEHLDDSPPQPERANATHKRSSSRASDPSGNRRKSSEDRRRLLEQFPLRGRVNNRSVSDTPYSQRRARSASISSQGSIKIARRVGPANNRSHPSRNVSRSRTSSRASADRLVLPPEVLYHPSETQMLADADTFQYHSDVRLQRRLFWHWRDLARISSDRHEEMRRKAEAFDRRIVYREALGALYFEHKDRQEEKAKERWRIREERRMQRTYELHILEKAFENWAVSAQDYVEKTATARRHILRLKYFNAWRDVTVVNEWKVRRHQVKKFFSLWKRKTATVLNNEDLALAVFEENLAKDVFSKWYWGYKENAAAYFVEDRLLRNFFFRWVDIVRKMKQREALVEQMWTHGEQRRILDRWRHKLEAARLDEARADDFRRRNTMSNALRAYSAQARLAPAYRQVSGAVSSRIAVSSLRTWRLRARQSQQAAEVNRMRVLRNALTSWDDQLRCSWLSRRIDDRVIVESLYKLSISSKASMFTRVQNYKLLSKWMGHWSSRARAHTTALERATSTFQRTQRLRRLRTALNRLQETDDAHQKNEVIAIKLRRSHVMPKTFNKWHERTQDLIDMNAQASAARFYVLTTNAIKLWRDATEQSQKLRRREAYVTMRRRCKANLVREMLNRWRTKAENIRAMDRSAIEKAEDHTMRATVNAFDRWRQNSQRLTDMSQQALSYRQTHLLRATLSKVIVVHARYQKMSDKAQTFRVEVTAIVAQKALTKLGRRLFQIRTLEQGAPPLREKHWRNHIRSMLRYWAERAAIARLQRTDPDNAAAFGADEDGDQDGRGFVGAGAFDDTYIPSDVSMARAEEWTALDDSAFDLGQLRHGFDLVPGGGDAEGLITSTPIPGYLHTPSRRSTARSKARDRLVALSGGAGPAPGTPGQSAIDTSGVFGRVGARTAPPTAGGIVGVNRPGITPFERKLRAQGYSARGGGGLRGSRTPGFGRRGGRSGMPTSIGRGRELGASAIGFEDIPEDDGSRQEVHE